MLTYFHTFPFFGGLSKTTLVNLGFRGCSLYIEALTPVVPKEE
jgi:hypothetical protein